MQRNACDGCYLRRTLGRDALPLVWRKAADTDALGKRGGAPCGRDGATYGMSERVSGFGHALSVATLHSCGKHNPPLRGAALYGILGGMDIPIPIMSVTDYQAECGRRFALLLRTLGLKQTEAAEIMGVSKHAIRNWRKGEDPIQVYGLYRLHRVKQIDFNFVFLGDWSRLPRDISSAIEAETLASLSKGAGARSVDPLEVEPLEPVTVREAPARRRRSVA